MKGLGNPKLTRFILAKANHAGVNTFDDTLQDFLRCYGDGQVVCLVIFEYGIEWIGFGRQSCVVWWLLETFGIIDDQMFLEIVHDQIRIPSQEARFGDIDRFIILLHNS